MRLATLILLCLAPACHAGFAIDLGPSVPASGGSVGLVGGDVVATNLAATSISDGARTVALAAMVDLRAGPGYADFFVLAGPVQAYHGTPPLAYGLFGTPSLAASGGLDHLAIPGMRARLSPGLAADFGADPSALYSATLTLDYRTDPSLAGGQVVGGSIALAPMASVPEPRSAALMALGVVLLIALRRMARGLAEYDPNPEG